MVVQSVEPGLTQVQSVLIRLDLSLYLAGNFHFDLPGNLHFARCQHFPSYFDLNCGGYLPRDLHLPCDLNLDRHWNFTRNLDINLSSHLYFTSKVNLSCGFNLDRYPNFPRNLYFYFHSGGNFDGDISINFHSNRNFTSHNHMLHDLYSRGNFAGHRHFTCDLHLASHLYGDRDSNRRHWRDRHLAFHARHRGQQGEKRRQTKNYPHTCPGSDAHQGHLPRDLANV